MTDNNINESNKKPSGKLIIGIVLVPIIFSWFSLKKGYSKNFKIISMTWMVITILWAAMAPPSGTPNQQGNNQAQTEKSQDATQLLSPDDQKIDSVFSQAKSYKVFQSDDISTGNRSRWKAFIYAPEAKTKDEQLATTAKAAMDILAKNRVQYAFVVLFHSPELNNDQPIISINFAPDEKDHSGEPMGGRFKIE